MGYRYNKNVTANYPDADYQAECCSKHAGRCQNCPCKHDCNESDYAGQKQYRVKMMW